MLCTCPCARVPCLALPATLLCLKCPIELLTQSRPAPPHCLLRPLPRPHEMPVPPCAQLLQGARGWAAPGIPLPAYSRLFLPFCCSSLGVRWGGRRLAFTSVRPSYCPAPLRDPVHPTLSPAQTHILTHTLASTHTHTVHCPVPRPLTCGHQVQPPGAWGLWLCPPHQDGAFWTLGTPIKETLRQEGEERAGDLQWDPRHPPGHVGTVG